MTTQEGKPIGRCLESGVSVLRTTNRLRVSGLRRPSSGRLNRQEMGRTDVPPDTGAHRLFGEYLCRIGKEPTTRCHHSDGNRDTAQHTLKSCPTWVEERGVLIREVGGDLSLPAVVRTRVGSENAWKTISSFCERVMLRKEKAEREREKTRGGGGSPPPPSGEGDEDGRGRRKRWDRGGQREPASVGPFAPRAHPSLPESLGRGGLPLPYQRIRRKTMRRMRKAGMLVPIFGGGGVNRGAGLILLPW